MDVDSESTIDYERNNDASVGGAVSSETGRATLDDIELDYHAQPQGFDSQGLRDDLNSSEQLEKNLSGEFDLNKQGESTTPDLSSRDDMETSPADPNSVDPKYGSVRSTDLVHDDTEIVPSVESTESDLTSDIERENLEATGTPAESESGKGSSSDVIDNEVDSSFQSSDPALRTSDPSFQESDLGFLYTDNRARGVGSLATGEFGAAAAAQSGRAMSDESLAREVKGKLTRESSGVNSPLRQEVARNIQVSSENGEVTLKGTVPSEKDKQMIEIHAAEMSGVKRVNNELTVKRMP
jgi:hypothetical protein